MDIYNKIKQLCFDSGISTNQLSKIIDISRPAIASWNKKSPTIDSLVKVANYFNVSLDYFVDRKITDNISILNNNKNNTISINCDLQNSSIMHEIIDNINDFTIMEYAELLMSVKSIKEKRN